MIIDLSAEIYNNMPHYPDDIDVKVSAENYEYFNITNISMCVHTATHIDTPLHCIKGKDSAASIDLNYFVGNAYCISIITFLLSFVMAFTSSTDSFKLIFSGKL